MGVVAGVAKFRNWLRNVLANETGKKKVDGLTPQAGKLTPPPPPPFQKLYQSPAMVHLFLAPLFTLSLSLSLSLFASPSFNPAALPPPPPAHIPLPPPTTQLPHFRPAAPFGFCKTKIIKSSYKSDHIIVCDIAKGEQSAAGSCHKKHGAIIHQNHHLHHHQRAPCLIKKAKALEVDTHNGGENRTRRMIHQRSPPARTRHTATLIHIIVKS